MATTDERPEEGRTENNPETGTANSFHHNEQGKLPEEADQEQGTPIAGEPLADRGDLGRTPTSEQQEDD